MTTGRSLLLRTLLIAVCLLCACGRTTVSPATNQLVRIAELDIDPARLETYKAFLKEEIEASIRVEPGVLTLYAVSLKDDPAKIRIFETYADVGAYRAHLKTPHFRKYKTGTQHMVRSLNLIEADAIMLGAKNK